MNDMRILESTFDSTEQVSRALCCEKFVNEFDIFMRDACYIDAVGSPTQELIFEIFADEGKTCLILTRQMYEYRLSIDTEVVYSDEVGSTALTSLDECCLEFLSGDESSMMACDFDSEQVSEQLVFDPIMNTCQTRTETIIDTILPDSGTIAD